MQVCGNSYAVVVSMENITLNWYFGNNRSMLLSNCIFRMGGAAILLTNCRREKYRSKYQLVHTVSRWHSCISLIKVLGNQSGLYVELVEEIGHFKCTVHL